MPQNDPLLYLVAGAFGASLVALAGGLFGAWLQSRREHSRWVREQRHAAYLDSIRAIEVMIQTWPKDGKPPVERYEAVRAALAHVMLLGPDTVKDAILEFLSASNWSNALRNQDGLDEQREKATDDLYAARDEVMRAARKVLGIRA